MRNGPPITTERGAFALDEGGALRLAVIADTHSRPHPRSAELVAALSPHHILHCGDIGVLSVLDDFGKIAPVTAVRGNIDVRAPEVPDVRVLDVTHGGHVILRILLTHIAVNGPRLRADAARLAAREDAHIVACGHSHVPFAGRDRQFTVFNPGSIGPRRFHLPIVFGVIDVRADGVSLKHVSCETGEEWRPS
ncbi:MAG: metallophosphoesterase family protein [Polyangiaceae bacterium]